MSHGEAPVNSVRAEGPGAIAVGGDAINSIFVTGGVNQFFVGQYERLADAYLNPRALYRELQLDRFTGRRWLLQAIDDFIASVDRGYIVIEGEAGVGKTAFMAWVARERRYVHHFMRLMPEANDIGVALRNLSAQLIRAWDLQSLAVGGVLPANASRPDFFEEVLFEAAEKRDATRPDEPIVIAIDGLNETTVSAIQNPLALPADLPCGVYIVASQRTVQVPLAVATPRKVLRIRADSPENLSDIRDYLNAAVAGPDLRDRLAAANVDAEDFARQLAALSDGVWLILRYVLAEVRSGTRSPDDLTSLPVSLWQYYARFWGEWQRTHAASWSSVDLPLLVTLTAAQEPISLDLLCQLSGCPDPDRAAGLVGDAWRPFLQVEEGAQERYAAFHDTLGEFVAGRVDPAALTSAERSFVERLSIAYRAAHARIADRYLTAWGGLQEGLPGLHDGDGAETLDGGYGLRHLVHHLVHASADSVLHGLMQLEWPRAEAVDPMESSPAANAWYETHRARRAFAGYALDVQRAWARAEHAPADPTGPRSIALELRYALVAASVNSVAGNVPTELLLLLIDDDLATTAQALELAREITDARSRAEALTALVPRLTGEVRQQAVREALASVQLVPDEYWRAGELVRLAPVAGPDHSDDLIRIANGISRGWEHDIALRALAEAPAPQEAGGFTVMTADPRVFAAQYLQRTRRGVTTLLLGVGRDLAGEPDVRQHIMASRFVRSPRWRAELLTASARTVSPEDRAGILQTALSVSLTVGDREIVNSSVGSVAARLAAIGDIAAALACVADMADPEGLAQAVFAIAAHAPASQRAGVMQRAVDAAGRIGDAVARGRLLHRHAAQLGELAGDGRLDQVLESLSDDWRVSVLGAMAQDAAPDQRQQVLAEALTTAISSSESGRARAIAELIPRLTPPLLTSARDALETIEDPEQRDQVAAALAGRLGGLGEAAGADDVMRTISDGYWLAEAQFGAACGLAASGRHDQATAVAARQAVPPLKAEALARAGRFEAAFELADQAPDTSTRIAVLLRIGSGGTRDGTGEAGSALADVSDPTVLTPLVNSVSLALARQGRPTQALDLIRRLPDDQRAAALIPAAPHLADAVPDAIALARTLRDPIQRAHALAALTPLLVAAHPMDTQDHVRQVLRLLATGTRAELLQATSDLLPGLTALAGPQGLVDMAAAITSAARWWP
jgi:hypothetical protein